ncbi:alpha/beta fold hydrolase [Paenibacillus barcinonensis]|uniref:Alpha/beta fold hydrolase n=1 Tax=Paenibacillus barcinonensis TaxID=198119 RepID=A0A2V4VZJ7_PAEBA|nr:alpha/beta fold hydrolase [Paenibacillus barcinonensis]PYE44325.1 nucleoside-diphosphate-sugar epimerase [Paenibacillus barcinonensis]QKS58323.1 alpha/beta fold hydrolase [Paenibacillus barcinonensis]
MNQTALAQTVLLMTGSTGFIGRETVKQLVEKTDVHMLLLVRSAERARIVLESYGVSSFEQITFIVGDLSLAGLGLVQTDRERIRKANVILHAGGTMDITLGRETANKIFMHGARELAQLAQDIQDNGGLRHFIHVVGYMSPYGQEGEQQEQTKVKHADSQESAYEEMKFQADGFIRTHAQTYGYPLSVVNPSTVVGPRPTGETEQTGGIGLLIGAVQRGFMPVVPGGSSYWLPLVENDVVAETLVFLTQDEAPLGGTYPLLARKEDSPNMKDMLNLITKQLDVPRPAGVLPLSWIQRLMKLGGSRISGIPAQSLAFITDRRFPVQETEVLLKRMGSSWPDIREQLPFIIADLDYRLLPKHEMKAYPERYTRSRLGNLARLGWEGEGEPWVIVHGLLQSADDLLPLGSRLRELTGNPVWLVDLAGFGRSPVHQEQDAFNGQVNALVHALVEMPVPIKLVGHSVGAAVAAAALKRSGRTDIRLALLQPAADNGRDARLKHMLRLPRRVGRALLRSRSQQSWARMFREGSSKSGDNDESMVTGTAQRVHSYLRSPRIAGAHLDLLRWIHLGHTKETGSFWEKYGSFQGMDDEQDQLVVWADKDKEYQFPTALHSGYKKIDVPLGHYFPVFQFEQTAEILVGWADGTHVNNIS